MLQEFSRNIFANIDDDTNSNQYVESTVIEKFINSNVHCYLQDILKMLTTPVNWILR